MSSIFPNPSDREMKYSDVLVDEAIDDDFFQTTVLQDDEKTGKKLPKLFAQDRTGLLLSC